ncbi:DUF1508 domain-containing protein [Pseudonocardia kujensis]|uniref:YegP family protein n=1 Tax=Pseudonocardia kujensis TaxID=1128675 RepID=UPI001E5F423A|nr:DUF1508 domain-containing protein [Pseudonocardia kujensis]MCE0765958.1 DUF1508 domain-containing protein [Pseudonocardia kujensis]
MYGIVTRDELEARSERSDELLPYFAQLLELLELADWNSEATPHARCARSSGPLAVKRWPCFSSAEDDQRVELVRILWPHQSELQLLPDVSETLLPAYRPYGADRPHCSIKAGVGAMAGKFEVYKDRAGKYRFRLKASNGQVVASGEAHETKAATRKGCESVQNAAAGATIVETDS